MGQYSLNKVWMAYLVVKKHATNIKILAIVSHLPMLFVVGCSSVDLDSDKNSEFSAPIAKSQNREEIVVENTTEKASSSVITTQKLPPNTVSNDLIKEYGDFEPAVYFDYDRFDVKPEYIEVIRKIADVMRGNNNFNILLEGHSDERGTREYNVALGHKRAESVAKALEAEGIDRIRMDTVSFGEENPVDSTQSEKGWSKNRRCDLIIKKGNLISE